MRNGGFRRRKEERWGDGDARFAAFNGGSKVRSSPRPPWPNDSTFSFSFFFFGRGGDEGGRRRRGRYLRANEIALLCGVLRGARVYREWGPIRWDGFEWWGVGTFPGAWSERIGSTLTVEI